MGGGEAHRIKTMEGAITHSKALVIGTLNTPVKNYQSSLGDG